MLGWKLFSCLETKVPDFINTNKKDIFIQEAAAIRERLDILTIARRIIQFIAFSGAPALDLQYTMI